MIMATDTKLDSLVINYLSQAQYDNAKREGTLRSNQIYMTPAQCMLSIAQCILAIVLSRLALP